MQKVTIISVGALKEDYFRAAVAEYEKRLSGLCRINNINLKEEPIKDEKSTAEILAALEREGDRILSSIPPRAYKFALCIEGAQRSSEELAHELEQITARAPELCFIIGSSHGLCERVKRECDARISFSRLTFPHRLMRVILLEVIYRALGITAGGKYHK